jgi:hypothetical protein
MGNPLQYRCIGCREKVVKHEVGVLRICRDCWAKLTVAERAARIEAMEQTELLRDIRGHLNALERGSECDANERVSTARALENLGRQMKLPAGKVTELVNQFQPVARLLFDLLSEAAAKGRQDDRDDDEPWRDSLKDDDE